MTDKQKELLMELLKLVNDVAENYGVSIEEEEFDGLRIKAKEVFGLDYLEQCRIDKAEEKKRYIEFVKDV